MINRTIYNYVQKMIKTNPVTLITGARQVGKSTLCKLLVKEYNFNYVSLDNIRERESAINDPELFLKIHKWPLIIDEVQYAPNLFNIIEQIVNEEYFNNDKNDGMFVLTGSEAYNLMEGVTESLAGRVSIVRMSPLSKSEIKSVEEKPFEVNFADKYSRTKEYKISREQLYNDIVRGFYPKLYNNLEIETEDYYSNYVDTYINRDVSQIINLNDKLKFQNFMQVLASFTGEELVYDTISKAVGVSLNTIKSWISVLVSGEIIYLLEPYNETSIVKRIVKRPKVYFNDTGLAAYLARLNSPQLIENSYFNGRFVETYIINEIRKSYLNNGAKTNFYYYRDNNQNEIDLIILYKGALTLVECKSGVSYKLSDVKAFKIIEEFTNYKVFGKCIICNTDKPYALGNEVYALPLSAI